MKAILSALLTLALLVSCSPRPKPPTLAEGEGIAVAKVGNFIITDKDLLHRIEIIESEFPRKFTEHVQKASLLQEMVHLELLAKQAQKLGLENTYEFRVKLADLYVDQISRNARKDVTDEEIEKFYQANRNIIDQVAARHILIKFKPDVPKAELRKQIEAIKREVEKDPQSFGEIAKKKSEDSSAGGGGDLGFFAAPTMVPEFSAAAFNLKKIGDISPVVETKYGFHIIQLTGEKRQLKDWTSPIRDELTTRFQKEALNKELERLKKEVPTEIFEANLLKLSPLEPIFTQDPDKNLNMKREP